MPFKILLLQPVNSEITWVKKTFQMLKALNFNNILNKKNNNRYRIILHCTHEITNQS